MAPFHSDLTMQIVKSLIDGIFTWMAANARSFSHMLPDSVEMALYLAIALYLGRQLAHHRQKPSLVTMRSDRLQENCALNALLAIPMKRILAT